MDDHEKSRIFAVFRWRSRTTCRSGLKDLRIHDCRHSYASRALTLGESLPMIGRLLGHTQIETTARYAHLARDSVHESAVRVSPRASPPTCSVATPGSHGAFERRRGLTVPPLSADFRRDAVAHNMHTANLFRSDVEPGEPG